MATLAPPAHLALASGDGPGLALGLGYPEVYWTLQPHDLTRGVLLLGGQGSGKCLSGHDLVLLAGTLIRAEDAWERYATAAEFDGEGWWSQPLSQPLTNALDADGRIVVTAVTRLYRQHVRERLRRVRLDDGSELTITRRHRLRGPDAWTNDFEVGDMLCVPRRLEWPGRPLDVDVVELLAWQVSEGCERMSDVRSSRGSSSVAITQKDRGVLEGLARSAGRVALRYGLNMNTPTITEAPNGCSVLTIRSAAWRDFLIARGYDWGQRSAAKSIPDFIMQADLTGARVFLRAFIAAEGSINPARHSLEIASASRLMLEQVRSLLLRFGVFSKLKVKRARATNGSGIWREYYRLMVGGPSVRRLARDIGVDHVAKQRKLDDLCSITENSNAEGVYVRDILLEAQALGVPLKWICSSTGYLQTHRAGRGVAAEIAARLDAAADRIECGEVIAKGARGVTASPTRAATIARVDTRKVRALAARLAQRVSGDVLYARIVEIEEVDYDGWVYDFEVAGKQNFVAGGMLAHNTSMLYRLLMHRALSPNTALVVFDMKGSLVERLLRQLPDTIEKRYYDRDQGEWRTGHKRVWYLDLANASFGLSPLEVREGWTIGGLADTFMNIAGVVVGALKDLFADQIFQSSQDIITRTVIGSMAIAWWEHVEEHRRRGTRPEEYGFSGSFEVLSRMLSPTDEAAVASGRDRAIPPNPWHVAAGQACQRIPELDQTAYQLLTAIPAAVNSNLSNMTQRFQAPANKITPLVAQYPAVRRFVEQGQRLSLQSVVEAHDILIVNPRMEVLGEEAPEILTTFMVHMLNSQLNRHLAYPADKRPRLTLGMDEAHRLLTPTLVRMLATHREAGLTVMAATQYFDQIASALERPAMQQMVRSGIRNLMQTVMIGRISDPDEAEGMAKFFRTVYESLTRSDPASQARIPVDAANIAALPEYNLLVRAITASRDSAGTEAQPVFLTRTLPMPEVHELRQTYRKRHLARMADLFGAPDAQPALRFVGRPPAGLMGEGGAVPYVDHDADAADVARANVGHRPDRRPSQPRTGERNEWSDAHEDEDAAPPADAARISEDVGGARVHWRQPTEAPSLDALVPLLKITMRPTDDPVPDEDAAPQWPLVQDAVRRAAEIEALFAIGAWSSEGDDQKAEADRKAAAAREAAEVRAKDQGMDDKATKRYVAAAATHARREVEAKYADQQWTEAVDELNMSAERLQELRVLAQLPYSHPDILRPLLGNARAERTVQRGLVALRRAALVSTAPVKIEDRLGKGNLPALSAVNARGRALLRHKLINARETVPPYLEGDKKLPGDGGALHGRDVAHELSVQVLAGALCQYGGTAVKCSWQLPNTGGRVAVAAFRKDAKGVERRDLVPPTQPDMAVVGYQQSALPVIAPDLTARFEGPVAGASCSIRVLFEVDRTDRPSYNADKLVAYDHLLAGWYAHLDRKFGKPPVRPLVLFVSRTEEAARALARRADATLNVGLGLPGHDPATYLYFGRSHMAFTCLSWLLAGQPYAFRVPVLPRDVRGAELASELQLVELLPRVWWPRAATSAPRAPR